MKNHQQATTQTKEVKIKEFKIKGRITPYTPTNRARFVAIAELPDYVRTKISEERLKSPPPYNFITVEKGVTINKRLCKITMWSDYEHCHIEPIDKPAPPKKPRVTDERAFNAYITFCRTRDWTKLFWAWEGCGRYLFREKLVELLKEYGNKNCDKCKFRFRCYTEK